MLAETKQAALEHALKEAPREACGLIVMIGHHERYFPCKNIAENQRDFILDPIDYMRAEDQGEVMAVVHSHPAGSSKETPADQAGCEISGLAWHIVSVPSGIWNTITPKGYKAPYIGREFVHGVFDCYSLIRDWYRDEMKIDLPDFDRREEWWRKGEDLYEENFRNVGFVEVKDQPQRGDIILMQNQSKVINHGAIYLGKQVILHHVIKRLSCRDVYGGYWLKNTRKVVRYQGKQ